MAVVLEKLLLNSANTMSTFRTGELPKELQLIRNDTDLARLKIQLLMLPNPTWTRNSVTPNTVSIKKVTNMRIIYDIINKYVCRGKEMLSEVLNEKAKYNINALRTRMQLVGIVGRTASLHMHLKRGVSGTNMVALKFKKLGTKPSSTTVRTQPRTCADKQL